MISDVPLLGFLLFITIVSPLAGQQLLPGPVLPPCSTVSDATSLEELARSCPELSTFSKLLAQADDYGKWMLDCGRKCGRLGQLQRTVFVPVNAAWAEYFAATGTSLAQLTSKTARKALTALMRYHVLPQVLPSSEVPSVVSEGAGDAGGRMVTLQGGSLLLARRGSSNSIRITGKQNKAQVLRSDIAIGKPLVHLVSSVLLLEPLPGPLSMPPLPPLLPSPPQSPPSPPPPPPPPGLPLPDPGSGPGGLVLPAPTSGNTVFNLTWDRPVDMDLIVVSELASGGTMTMFYSYQGPEKLIGGAAMSAYSEESGPLSGFYSRTLSSWEALKWEAPKRPAQAVYTICSFFYNLEWAAGTVISAASPVRPLLTVTTDSGAVLVAAVSRPLTQWGQFSFTLLPRNCDVGCPWFLAQVCVDAQRRIRVVTPPDRC